MTARRERKLPIRLLWLAAVSTLAGCVIADLELAGRHCPCIDGWQCRNGLCVLGAADVPDGAASGPAQLEVAPSVTVVQGKSVPLAITWPSPDDGELQVTATNLPVGISAVPGVVVLSKSAPSATFTLTAATDAPTTSSTLVVKALGPNSTPRATAPVVVTVTGRSGSPDTSFGTGGVVSFTSTSTAQPFFAEIRRRDDGRFVVAGTKLLNLGIEECFWTQLSASGQPDDAFARGVSFGEGCNISGMGLTADGRARALVRVGSATQLRGLTLDGAPDTAFGDGGVAPVPIDNTEPHTDFWLLPDGRAIVGGRQTSTGTVARYDASGNLDRTFGSGGKVTAPFGTYATTILEQADGKLVVGSFANDATVLRITRVDSSGAVDPTYGTGGHFEETLSFPQLVALQQDDRVLLGGSVVDVGGKPGVLLFRHDATGQREGSADGGGAPITQLDKVDELYVAPGGQVYVIGTSHGFIAIARLRPSLELDPDFGVAGVVLGPAAEDTQSFLVEPDGKMVVVGVSTTFWLVARLWP